jgi:hypothetical protein
MQKAGKCHLTWAGTCSRSSTGLSGRSHPRNRGTEPGHQASHPQLRTAGLPKGPSGLRPQLPLRTSRSLHRGHHWSPNANCAALVSSSPFLSPPHGATTVQMGFQREEPVLKFPAQLSVGAHGSHAQLRCHPTSDFRTGWEQPRCWLCTRRCHTRPFPGGFSY